MRTLILVVTFVTFSIAGRQIVFADENDSVPENVTIVHYPNSGATNGISKHLGRLLGDDVVTVELPDQNMLLIRVPVDQQQKVTKLIQAIDVPRAMIRYRLVWLYTKTKLDTEQLKGLQGSVSKVDAFIEKLGEDGDRATVFL